MALLSNVRYPWEELQFRTQRRDYTRPRKIKPITAVDTETIDGIVWLIADNRGNYSFPKTWGEVLDWLDKNELWRTTIFAWNLDYDARAILALLPEEILLELALTDFHNSPHFKIHYVPRKFLVITYKQHKYQFFDLMQYYGTSLNNAAKEYLGVEKLDVDTKRLSNDEAYRRKNLNLIIKYCIRDAELTSRLGLMNVEMYAELGVHTNSWFSTGYIAGKYFLANGGIPRYHNRDAQRYAYYSYAGGRFECFKRGQFDEAYKYDLTSAYPAVIATLPNLDKGKWVREQKLDYDADLIFAHVRAKTFDNYVQPLHVKQNGLVMFPEIGEHNRVVTKSELEVMRDYELAEIEVQDAWHFYAESSDKPFATVRDMYEERAKLRKAGDKRQIVLKVVMNSLYGKFIQITPEIIPDVVNKVGPLFVPAYAAEITAQTRVALLRTILEKELEPIAFFTDAIITEDKMSVPRKTLGSWDLEKKGELVLLGCGVYGFNDSDSPDTHARGFSIPRTENLFTLLDKHSTKTTIPFKAYKPISLGEFAQQSILRQSHWLNQWILREKRLSINFDRKRHWSRQWSRASEILKGSIDSVPFRV